MDIAQKLSALIETKANSMQENIISTYLHHNILIFWYFVFWGLKDEAKQRQMILQFEGEKSTDFKHILHLSNRNLGFFSYFGIFEWTIP